MIKKSIAVLGLGKYGCSLAESLYSLGEDVLVADKNETVVRDMSPKVTSAVCANLDNEDEVTALGLQNMDIVITCMGGNLSASILSVAIAKEKGVPVVIAKASSDRMKMILERVGADKIICPEEEGGVRSARILTSQYIRDYFEIDENLCMIELQPKKAWIGKDLIELNLRKKYNMNVAAIKRQGGNWSYVDPSHKLREDNLLMIIIEKDDIDKWR
ncbi:potassium channel family protein [Butyrivibrio sp. YAB3001]|uniref:potassium channel family protein n=1 Tax=Butyrivibrio sp. YAB3001 TaxID=1520812 RepID=UPI0008F66EC4|nr:TrkA family potassium uptake protein [Butyrivibrio sp. YAB3001]SFC48388.1 trk system potassium uptake protein TrkA [Butyrivibrio sp. YAB3001]